MEDTSVHRDKPRRPGDYPRPGPSWDEADTIEDVKPLGVPDGED